MPRVYAAVRLAPDHTEVAAGEPLVLDLLAEGGGSAIGAFSVRLRFDPTRLVVSTDVGDQGIDDPAAGLAPLRLAVDNHAGTIAVSGFSAAGLSADAPQRLFSVHLRAGQRTRPAAVAIEHAALAPTQSTAATITPVGAAGISVLPGPTTRRLAVLPGWNLLFAHWDTERAGANCTGLRADLGGQAVIERIATIDDATGHWRDCTDELLLPGRAYALLATVAHAADTAVAGGCPSWTLRPGVNLLGHPAPSSGLGCHAWLAQFGADLVTAIGRLDPRTGRAHTCAFAPWPGAASPIGSDFPIQPDEGNLIHAREARDLPVPGCID